MKDLVLLNNLMNAVGLTCPSIKFICNSKENAITYTSSNASGVITPENYEDAILYISSRCAMRNGKVETEKGYDKTFVYRGCSLAFGK